MATAAPTKEEMLQALQQTLGKKKVLIIDKNAPSRESLRLMFGTIGVTAVHGAGSAAEVVRQVKNTKFDVIISEFVLDDGRDGQQLLEELRHAKYIPLSTVYMIVTSERGYTNVVSLAELAPDDYLIKPFTADQLQPRLIRAIYRKFILRKIYERLERNELHEAIVACDRVVQQYPAYAAEAQHYKGDILLNLGRYDEAEEVFSRVLEEREVPWAKMGLATALRDKGALDDAESLAKQVLDEAPQFLALHDFLAGIYTAKGDLEAAQATLQKAAEASPHNTARQRTMGDVALRNGDLQTAQRAFGRVLERNRGSTTRCVDDFANLARVYVERGDYASSRRLLGDLKREFRNDRQAELAAMTTEVLCLQAEGSKSQAAALLKEAVALQKTLQSESVTTNLQISPKIATDLAMACYQGGMNEEAAGIIRKVAAENNEDHSVLDQIHSVFERTGRSEAGQTLLDNVNKEIIELNNRGGVAARQGNFEGSVKLLIEAADKVPNLQFLVNASKAIYTLLDQKGWDSALASRALNYLQRAEQKDPQSPKVASAKELYMNVSKKYGTFADPNAYAMPGNTDKETKK